MRLLGTLSETDFIQRYWQKEPLLLRGGLATVQELVAGDDLAALACEQAVASRIVIGNDRSDRWDCEYGPFEDERFDALPRAGWTLLVSSVDEQIPEVRALLSHFTFLPRWRVDDIMVSYASPGGGVGPHFDYYDVFLIQGAGTRTWRLGQRCDAHSPLRPHPDLRLLQDFETRDEHHVDPGDVLYVPPGLAHWGSATSEDCITFSVGFRAPSHAEILQGTAERLALGLEEDRRYRDTVPGIDADPFLVNAAALAEIARIWSELDAGRIADALIRGFGEQVTLPRNPDQVLCEDLPDRRAIDQCIARGEPIALDHHPSSRFAYAVVRDRGLLFADGEVHETSPEMARGLCHGDLAARLLEDTDSHELLMALLSAGQLAIR